MYGQGYICFWTLGEPGPVRGRTASLSGPQPPPMPTRADDTVTKEVLYPDDLTGETLEIDPEGRLNGELAFWNAEDPEDTEDLPDGAKRGWWLPVDSADHGQVWASMPRDLRESLAEKGLTSGDIIEVLSHEKGPGDTDPWMAEVAVITDG